MTIYYAAQRYAAEHVSVLVIAGEEYGGRLIAGLGGQGYRVAWCPSGDRKILRTHPPRQPHRHGVLPVQFEPGQGATTLGLSGEETFTVRGLDGASHVPDQVRVTVAGADGNTTEFSVRVRIETRAKQTTTATEESCRICCAVSPHADTARFGRWSSLAGESGGVKV
jgi:aconitate hydratase